MPFLALPRSAPRLAIATAALLAAIGCADTTRNAPRPPQPDRDAPIDIEPLPDAGPILVDAGPPPMTLPAPREVGASCDNGGDCDTGGCFRRFPFPWRDGYCSAGCDSEDDCAGGSTCEPLFTGFAMCLDNCDPMSGERTCRAGYGCAARPTGTFACLPGCTDDTDCLGAAVCAVEAGGLGAGICFTEDATLGDACNASLECALGDQCFSEAATSWPGGVCASGPCNPTDGSGCREGGACIPTTGGGGVCVAGCTDDDACREGYACQDGACQPACTDDAQCSGPRVCNPDIGRCTDCASDEDCSGDQVCADATGTCVAPFDPRDYGRLCASDDSVCEAGLCLEESDGYPGSYCVFEGCSDLEACPGDGVCVPGIGDAPGLCHRPCASDDGCRSGYTCQGSDPDLPDSPRACLPAPTG